MPDINVSFTDLAFRYTSGTGLVALAIPDGFFCARAYGISDDGTQIVGVVAAFPSSTNRACVWTNGTPTVLGILSGGSAASAAGISADGTVIVGQCRDSSSRLCAVKWTNLGAATLLGALNGAVGGYAAAVSSDGSKIVGVSNDGFGLPKYVSWSGTTPTALFNKPTNYSAAVNYLKGDSVYSSSVEWEATADMTAPAPTPTPLGTPWNHAAISASGTGCSHDGTHTCGITSSDGLGIIPADGSLFPQGVYDAGSQSHDASANFIGQLGTTGSALNATCNAGNAVGSSTDGSGHLQAVWYDGATLRELSPLGGATNTQAFAVSSGAEVIAGASASKATIWNNTGPTSYSAAVFIGFMPGGTYSFAEGITGAADVIVGYGDAAPGVPTPSCGEVHSGTGFTAAWVPALGGVPDTYTLDYRKVGTVPFTEVTGITDVSFFIDGLDPATAYEFKVQAVNAAGTSSFSVLQGCSTDTAVLAVALPPTLHRWRGQVGINWRGLALVGDAFSSVVGLSDFNAFTEYGNTMRFLITAPPIHDDRKRIFMPRFEIEVEAGAGLPDAPEQPPQMMLRWSKDGGKTWSSLQPFRSMGAIGEFIKRLRWLNLGNARTWIFELSCTDPVRRVIIGVYADSYKGLG